MCRAALSSEGYRRFRTAMRFRYVMLVLEAAALIAALIFVGLAGGWIFGLALAAYTVALMLIAFALRPRGLRRPRDLGKL